jgi:hypothetical protein
MARNGARGCFPRLPSVSPERASAGLSDCRIGFPRPAIFPEPPSQKSFHYYPSVRFSWQEKDARVFEKGKPKSRASKTY